MFPEPLRISLISHKKTKGGWGEEERKRGEKEKRGIKS